MNGMNGMNGTNGEMPAESVYPANDSVVLSEVPDAPDVWSLTDFDDLLGEAGCARPEDALPFDGWPSRRPRS